MMLCSSGLKAKQLSQGPEEVELHREEAAAKLLMSVLAVGIMVGVSAGTCSQWRRADHTVSLGSGINSTSSSHGSCTEAVPVACLTLNTCPSLQCQGFRNWRSLSVWAQTLVPVQCQVQCCHLLSVLRLIFRAWYSSVP